MEKDRESLVVHWRSMEELLLISNISKKSKSMPLNMTVSVGTGWNGENLEQYLNEQNLTMGHIPQSVRTSTVGGYIAHRAAGQYSTKYGKMEDILLGVEVVLPTGEILRTKAYPRASVGPMADKLFLGGEVH